MCNILGTQAKDRTQKTDMHASLPHSASPLSEGNCVAIIETDFLNITR